MKTNNIFLFLYFFICHSNLLWASDFANIPKVKQNYGQEDGTISLNLDFQAAIIKSLKERIEGPIKKQGLSSQIGVLDLNKLVEEIEQVSIYINTTEEAFIGNNNRIGAVYLKNDKKVVLNLSLLNALTSTQVQTPFSVEAIEVLLLHEVLGALGYPDDDYNISSYLYIRSNALSYSESLMNTSANMLVSSLMIFKDSMIEDIDSGSGGGGGSTVVAGGGDPLSAGLKILLLSTLSVHENYYRHYLESDEQYAELVRYIMNANIEPQIEAQMYNFNGDLIIKTTKKEDDQFSILVSTPTIFYLDNAQSSTMIANEIIINMIKEMNNKKLTKN